MDSSPHSLSELSTRCQLCREDVHERLNSLDRRMLAMEITVRGEDGRNGLKAQLRDLIDRFDQFEKKSIRWIAVGTSIPGVVVSVVAVLKFFGHL